MTLVSFTDCCLQLDIDPKTLRGWLKAAHLSPCLHPADGRVKCLTRDQLSKLAALHDRRLLLAASQPITPLPAAPAPSMQVSDPPAATSCEIAELRHQVTLLQAQMITLQAQVTELALVLVRGPSASLQASASVQTPQAAQTATPAPRFSPPPSSPRPKPLQTSSRVLSLIEVRPDGTPVVISPSQGVLPLVPDSPDWFAWLGSLKSFSFRCSHGQFNANRRFDHGKPIQSWNLRRTLHGRSSVLYLGHTHTLTFSHLQEMAATLHARQASS